MFRRNAKLQMDAAIKKIEGINNAEAKNSQEVDQIYFDIRDACVAALEIYLNIASFPEHKKDARKLVIELKAASLSYEKIKEILNSSYQALECIQYKSYSSETEKIGRFHTIVKISAEKTFRLSGLHYETHKAEKAELERLFIRHKQ